MSRTIKYVPCIMPFRLSLNILQCFANLNMYICIFIKQKKKVFAIII